MATFQVPQFIEEKAKIVGFLTLSQFIYVAVGAGVSFIAFSIFNLFVSIIITVIIATITISLAFVKINNQPMPKVISAAFLYFWKPRVYTWNRETKETSFDDADIERIKALRNHVSIQQKLQSIALNIATGKIFSPERHKENKKKERYQVVTYITGEHKVAKRVDY